MKCNKDFDFVICGDHIEKRRKNGDFLFSICCPECLPALKKIIAEFEKEKKE